MKRQSLPPLRHSKNIKGGPSSEVYPLNCRARILVEEPKLARTWLIHIPGTSADPSLFPPDRTLPQLAFDFRDLMLNEPESSDPFQAFYNLLEQGFHSAFCNRKPKHLVFVGHSFGGMLALKYLLQTNLLKLKMLVPSVNKISCVAIGAAHTSPIDRFRLHSDAPLVGGLATWLSHFVTSASSSSRDRVQLAKKLMCHAPPRELWRKAMRTSDELSMCGDMPMATSVDHVWAVVRCARNYDISQAIRNSGIWFDLLVLSAEYDAQWPADMFEDFWSLLNSNHSLKTRWCEFPGDDHMTVARYPTKYYKEIKDFLLS